MNSFYCTYRLLTAWFLYAFLLLQTPVGTRAEELVLRIPMRVVKGDENGVWPLNYGAVDLTVAFG